MKQPLILTLLMMASICTSMAQQMDRPNMKPTSFIQQESSDSSIEQPCLIDRDLPAQQTAASSVTESLGMGGYLRHWTLLFNPIFSKTCALMLLSTPLWQSATSLQKKQSQAILNNLSHKKEIQNPYQPFQKPEGKNRPDVYSGETDVGPVSAFITVAWLPIWGISRFRPVLNE